MRVKGKGRKTSRKTEKNNAPLRRSLRLKLLSVSLSTDRSAKSRVKNKKPCYTISTNKIGKSKQSKIVSAKSKQHDKTTAMEKTKKEQPDRELTKIKEKQHSFQQATIDDTKEQINNECCAPVQKANEVLELKLLKTITVEKHHYGKANITRFSDVAFLDDNHILALDDNWMTQKHGQRICCIRLDGTLVCDLLVPGYPWSVVVLGPTEAVVSMRRLESNGLIWISVDVHSQLLEITRHLPFEEQPYGLSYMDRLGVFLVSYCKQPYMSVLNQRGEEIKKITVAIGDHYRCLIWEDESVLYLDNRNKVVSVIDQEGKETLTIKHDAIQAPTSVVTDCFGNIYVGNFRTGEILKFDRNGKHRGTFHSGPNLCGMAIDRASQRIIATRNASLLVYKLNENV